MRAGEPGLSDCHVSGGGDNRARFQEMTPAAPEVSAVIAVRKEVSDGFAPGHYWDNRLRESRRPGPDHARLAKKKPPRLSRGTKHADRFFFFFFFAAHREPRDVTNEIKSLVHVESDTRQPSNGEETLDSKLFFLRRGMRRSIRDSDRAQKGPRRGQYSACVGQEALWRLLPAMHKAT